MVAFLHSIALTGLGLTALLQGFLIRRLSNRVTELSRRQFEDLADATEILRERRNHE